jgi:hypothetical protein
MGSEHRTIALTALKALAAIGDRGCGPLSPLARIAAPEAPADGVALSAFLDRLDGGWRACVPALIDPQSTLAVIVADREQQKLGQWLWPDARARGPGFRVDESDDALRLHGPLAMAEIAASIYDYLAPEAVSELSLQRFELSADQVWALLALIDTYATAAALRSAARASGLPPGVAHADVVASWQAGLTRPNPGWSVSLAAMLMPQAVPEDFPARLQSVMGALDAAGLLTRLDAAADDPLGDIYLLGNDLDLLSRGLADGAIGLGLVRAEVVAPGHVEQTTLAGWRTNGGFVLLNLSELESGRAELMLCGPTDFVDLIDSILGLQDAAEDAPAAWEASAAQLIDDLRRRLHAGVAMATPGTCPKCGSAVSAHARFCGSCGHALQP